MKTPWLVPALAVLASGALFVENAGAQESGTRMPVPHENVISTNPFFLLASWLSVEFEHKIGASSTVGAMGSHFTVDGDGNGDVSLTGLSGFFRFYPQEAALNGFYLEGRLGTHRAADDDDSGQAFAFGVHIGYTWLFGSDRNFYLSMGLGADRLFGGDLQGASPTIPSLRFVKIGMAF